MKGSSFRDHVLCIPNVLSLCLSIITAERKKKRKKPMQCDAKQVVSNTVDLIKHSFERY